MSISSIFRLTPFSIGFLKYLIITSLIFFCTLLSGCNKNDSQKEVTDEQHSHLYNSDLEGKIQSSEHSQENISDLNQKEVDQSKLDEEEVENTDLDKENYQEYQSNQIEKIEQNKQEELLNLNDHQQNKVNTYEKPVESNQQIIKEPEEKIETKVTKSYNSRITHTNHNNFIGDTKIIVHVRENTHEKCSLPKEYINFINLDNTTSPNDNVMKILNRRPGSNMYLDYGTRNSTIKFNLDGNEYEINPKYIFNDQKIRSDLQKQKHYSSKVFLVVKDFSRQLLNEMFLGNNTIIDLSDNIDLFNLVRKNIKNEDTLYVCKGDNCLKGENYVIVTSNSAFTTLKKNGKFNVILYTNQLHDSGTLIENITKNIDLEYYPKTYINLYSNNNESYGKMLNILF